MAKLKAAAKQGYGQRTRWDESFKDEQFQYPSKPKRIRLGDELCVVPMHWVEFFSEQKGKKTGFFELCINHDYDEEVGDDTRGCPLCALGYSVTKYSYAYCLDRSEQRRGNLQIKPIRLTPKATNDIVKLSNNAFEDEPPEGWEEDDLPDATDPKFGFDITINIEEKNSKTEYPVHVATKNPLVSLTKEEFRAFKTYYSQVNFAELAKKGQPSVAEVQAKLVQLGLAGGGEAAAAKKPGKTKAKSAEHYDSFDDDDDEQIPDDDSEDTKKKPASKDKPAGKKRKVVESVVDDDDDGDLPWDEEDEDEGVSRTYATANEDDAPADEDDED